VILLSHVIDNLEATSFNLIYSSTSRQATSLVPEANSAYPIYVSVLNTTWRSSETII